MIKFHCEHCNQKLGVPEQYAGKMVRCTGCKKGAKVPAPEPEELEDVDLESYEVDDTPEDDYNPLADLDMLTGESQELQELNQAPAPAAGNNCPHCGAGVAPNAVLCIQCGNNLQAGGKVKTKITKEKASGGGGFKISGRAIVAVIVGGIVSGILGFLWFIVAAIFSMELGILAWGIGGISGLIVAGICGNRSVGVGLCATAVAAFGLFVGKGLIYLTVVGLSMLPGAMDSLGDAMTDAVVNDPDLFAMTYMGYMEEERMFEPDLQAKVDAVPEDEFYDDALYEQLLAAAKAETADMTVDDRKAFMESYSMFSEEESAEIDEGMQDLRDLDPLAETFSWWDLLWFTLALGSAFSIGKGKE